MVGPLPGSPILRQSLLAEMHAFGHGILLSTSPPCSPLHDSALSQARRGEAVASAPRSGDWQAAEATAGGRDAPLPDGVSAPETPLNLVADLVTRSSRSESAGGLLAAAHARCMCDLSPLTRAAAVVAAASSEAVKTFTHGRVLFVALGTSLPVLTGLSAAQVAAAGRAADAARAAGAEWVVVYGERPQHLSTARIRGLLGGVANVYVGWPRPAAARADGAVAGERTGPHADGGHLDVSHEVPEVTNVEHDSGGRSAHVSDDASLKAPPAVVTLGDGVAIGSTTYVRLRLLDGNVMSVEMVRAEDGLVLEAVSVTRSTTLDSSRGRA